MKKALKKTIVLAVLSIAIPACLFADKWFTLSLDYRVRRDCDVVFWQPGTVSGFDNSTVDISDNLGTESFLFASLGLSFVGETIISLELGWTPFYKRYLVNGSYEMDTGVSFDYELALETKGNSSQYCWDNSGKETEDGFVSGLQVRFSRKRLIEQANASQVGTPTYEAGKNLVADMYISDLQVDESETGEYISFLICYITVE